MKWAARLEPAVRTRIHLLTLPNRGARIRTGDLCDPNAALYRTEPHPGLLGYLHRRGGIELRAAMPPSLHSRVTTAGTRVDHLSLESNSRGILLRSLRGFEREGRRDSLVHILQ